METDRRRTGISWLEGLSIPARWSQTKVKYLVRDMRAGEAITADDIQPEGRYPVYGGNGLRGYTNAYTHSGTRILIGRQGALCGNVHLVTGDFWASEHAIVAETVSGVDGRWLTHLLRVMNLGQYSQTSAQPGIGTGQISALAVPLPTLEEQCAIADYLGTETAHIDVLIQAQQHLVSLLTERRRAVAADVLGVRVGTGDRLKWLVTEIDHRAGDKMAELPLLSVSISWGVRRRDEVSDELSRADDLSNYKVCGAGDLVINRMRAFQGALGLAPESGLVSPDYAVLEIDSSVDSGWLAAVMKTPAFVAEMAQRVKGIGSAELGSVRTPRINVTDLGDIRIDVPNRPAQLAESSELRRQVATIDELVAHAKCLIGLAQERRAALIVAAVTGQTSVSNVA
ncbi:MAG: restriction endonuclease subunit S [Actinobacteria bacterium]|nr:restriction endonuclease subunit S [Actinomycetota bacterium]